MINFTLHYKGIGRKRLFLRQDFKKKGTCHFGRKLGDSERRVLPTRRRLLGFSDDRAIDIHNRKAAQSVKRILNNMELM